GQVIDSGTSIGANYREANAAESPKDFRHKINLSFKEAKETKYWLEILIDSNSDYSSELMILFKESDELMRIFGKSVTTCRNNAKIKHAK
ncbi:four helix bundle protein, partial [Patescibacteria group bacterium]|nr:four helix bundle protein [Patescibacteria group bacterium]